MAALDKLSGDLVKALEEKAKTFFTWTAFEAWARDVASKVWNEDGSNGLSSGNEEELLTLAGQYDRPADFQNEVARYAELAWGHARNASDPGPQPNAHLTGTPAEGDYMKGHPDKAPWATGTETVEEHGVDLTVQEVPQPAQHRNVFDRTSDEKQGGKSYE